MKAADIVRLLRIGACSPARHQETGCNTCDTYEAAVKLVAEVIGAEDCRREAEETANKRRLLDRIRFQVEHPHYTPRPGADYEAWESWFEANTRLHGVEGFRERFPRHYRIIAERDRAGLYGVEGARDLLEAASYARVELPCDGSTFEGRPGAL